MSNYIIEEYPTKQEWLKARGIGGTDASAILGVSPYKTKLDIYMRFCNPNYEEVDQDNEILKYGRDCEDLIRQQFALDFIEQYETIAPSGYELYRRIDKPFITATPDGVLRDKATNKFGVLEIKTHDIRNREDDENWKTSLPQNYYCQVIHDMVAADKFEFIVLVAKLRFFDYHNEGGKKLIKTEIRYYYIDREEKIKDIEVMENSTTNFYKNYILKKVLPPIQR